MIKNEIGINAGIVWSFLSESVDKHHNSIKILKSLTKLCEIDFYMALGWLARESKVYFYEEGDGKKIMLIE